MQHRPAIRSSTKAAIAEASFQQAKEANSYSHQGAEAHVTKEQSSFQLRKSGNLQKNSKRQHCLGHHCSSANRGNFVGSPACCIPDFLLDRRKVQIQTSTFEVRLKSIVLIYSQATIIKLLLLTTVLFQYSIFPGETQGNSQVTLSSFR